MSTFERIKQINQRTKDLINGYIRECQDTLFGDLVDDNAFYNIPQLINTHCMAFYQVFTWYKKKHSDGLKFLSDSEVIVSHFNRWRTCFFENEISNKICNKFDITFKVISFGKEKEEPDFCIGYTTTNTIEESMIDWQLCLGETENKHTSAAWAFYSTHLFYNGNCIVWESMEYSPGDLLRVSFDFEKNTVKVYQNAEEKDCQGLEATKLWIGLSMTYEGNQITMVEYKYD